MMIVKTLLSLNNQKSQNCGSFGYGFFKEK